jgi:hypothetical protein
MDNAIHLLPSYRPPGLSAARTGVLEFLIFSGMREKEHRLSSVHLQR